MEKGKKKIPFKNLLGYRVKKNISFKNFLCVVILVFFDNKGKSIKGVFSTQKKARGNNSSSASIIWVRTADVRAWASPTVKRAQLSSSALPLLTSAHMGPTSPSPPPLSPFLSLKWLFESSPLSSVSALFSANHLSPSQQKESSMVDLLKAAFSHLNFQIQYQFFPF